ncbi:MAG: bacterioferritin [Gammaproteobacteria bacterium]|nr:MAG: bacterioferritin [Gammaproteobacteria bacterium]
MKGSAKVIAELNKVLKIELTSINQYFLHARMYKNWGLDELNSACYKKSIKDMKQADDLIERILFLEGLPNLQELGKLYIGEHTEEMLKLDMQFQLEQIPQIKEAIVVCGQEKDFVSRGILQNILKYEEDYVDWLEVQEFAIENAGMQNYIQLQMSEGD